MIHFRPQFRGAVSQAGPPLVGGPVPARNTENVVMPEHCRGPIAPVAPKVAQLL